MRGQVVSVFNLGQFIFAGLMAWPLFGEAPALAFYPACVLLLIGGTIVIRDDKPATPLPATRPLSADGD